MYVYLALTYMYIESILSIELHFNVTKHKV